MWKGVRKWPIRKQIMSSFLALVIILQIIIFCTIYANMQLINQTCTDGIATNVASFTKTNMNYIAKEKGAYIELLKGEFGDIMFIFKYLYNEIYAFNSTLTHSQYPSLNFSQTFEEYPSDFDYTQKNYYGDPPVSWDHSCIWHQNDSFDDPSGEDQFFKQTSAQLDRFYGLFQSPFFSDGVQRVNIVYLKNLTNTTATKLLRVWPCQKILNDSLKLDDINEEGTWKYTSYAYEVMRQKYPNQTDYPFIILSGPLFDLKNGRYPACSFNTMLVMADKLRGYIQIEIRNSYFFEMFKALSFLKTGTVVFFNLFGQIISPSPLWTEFDPLNVTQKIYEITYRTGIDASYYLGLYNRLQNSDELRYVKIMDPYYQPSVEYYESTVLLPDNYQETTYGRWEFGIILYVQKAEIESIQRLISDTINQQTSVILVIGMFCCTLTAAIIIVFCYHVAMSISKPLKNVIRVADFINQSAGNKDAISQIIADVGGLPEGEFQLKVLIKAFKNFIGIVDGDKKKQTAMTKPCFYPLNQFNREYLDKAKKGISPVNWYSFIEKVENIAEQEDESELELDPQE